MTGRDGLQSTIALRHGQGRGEGGSLVLGDLVRITGGRLLASGAGWTRGYSSWRECVIAEFKQLERYLYRQLEAAQTTKQIWPIGQTKEIPESQLRPLAKLRDNPDQQREAWAKAVETAHDGQVTAAAASCSRIPRGRFGAWSFVPGYPSRRTRRSGYRIGL